MLTVHHIPVCPFSQRLEILLALKGCPEAVAFEVVDITQPRAPELLRKTGGSTALPVLETADGTVLRESLVILRYLDMALPGPPVAQAEPLRHAVENLLVAQERDFGHQGYAFVMNQDSQRRDALRQGLLDQYARLDELLCRHSARGPWLFQRFGWAEAVFTPLFMRFWFLGYYEGFELPDEPRFARVRAWQEACLEHPAAQQVTREQIVKLYHDYARGAGNGALLPGRTRSSFVLAPHWSRRPWPPRDKWGPAPGDAELGLL
ncbi:MAG: glutathione S-transferase family protein [Burkholderiales bacterium]|nr:glutathione S-transferase family protein [Burkholderiales bacterium]